MQTPAAGKRKPTPYAMFTRLLLPALLLLISPLMAQTPPRVLLWPNGTPGALGDRPEDKPTLTYYLPTADQRSAAEKGALPVVVSCPGGGYSMLADEHEGEHVAQWLNALGVAAVVLRYRLGKWEEGGYRHPAMLQDAQWAIRTVRSRAAALGIDPRRVGILGFSAGGHLAATAGTHYDAGQPMSKDPIARMGSRPDFMVLVYPVITFEKDFAHQGSSRFLLGPDPDPALLHSLSNETQVDSLTPPTFLVHSDDDDAVPPQNSVYFYLALKKAGVPAELHIYDHGGHGYGMADGQAWGKGNRAPNDPHLNSWTTLCGQWLRSQGLLH